MLFLSDKIIEDSAVSSINKLIHFDKVKKTVFRVIFTYRVVRNENICDPFVSI